ncbi:hypothetical protein Syun_005723 [Stephania yunnanensis]|uniref:Inosine/uridine-preferring nucleoside hydrolase domain-containing protein n=1 Tax=Stephania yunnanensis TaxID=152371 RepID=A0AAP0PWW6_9MAGN
MGQPKKKIIIDTDPGIDDAMAIFVALGSPELEVIGLTTILGTFTQRSPQEMLFICWRLQAGLISQSPKDLISQSPNELGFSGTLWIVLERNKKKIWYSLEARTSNLGRHSCVDCW